MRAFNDITCLAMAELPAFGQQRHGSLRATATDTAMLEGLQQARWLSLKPPGR